MTFLNRVRLHQRTAHRQASFLVLLTLFSLQTIGSIWAQNTVGLLLNTPSAALGYTLFAPNISTHTYLINNEGKLINRWTSAYTPGNSAYLLENGNLFRTAKIASTSFNAGGAAGRVEEYDWEGNLLWGYDYSNTEHRQHHDALKLPNGNVLLIAWEHKTNAQAVANGRNPSLVTSAGIWPDTIVEIAPSGTSEGTVVWKWTAWDHLIQDYDVTTLDYGVVGDHPELIDINMPGDSSADWLHCNGIDYNPDLDQILISVPDFDEIWVIDHSTTTAEAAGHSGGNSGKGGDLLYRWGNPAAYRAGTSADKQLFFQHNPNWIKPGLPGAGNILIYNNGRNRPAGAFSTVEEIVPPVDINGNYSLSAGPGSAYGPSAPLWNYTAPNPTDFYAPFISGAQRQPNGNTLICNGAEGNFFEVTAAGQIVWQYLSPVSATGLLNQGETVNGPVFRSPRYAPNYPGLVGRDLIHWGTIELYPGTPLKIIKVVTATPALRIRWTSQPDTVYTIEYSPELENAIWTQIATVTALGTESHFTDTDPARTLITRGFYRVVEP